MASRTEQISEVMRHLHNAAGQLQTNGYTPDLILVAMFELVLRVQHQVSGKPGVRTMLEMPSNTSTTLTAGWPVVSAPKFSPKGANPQPKGRLGRTNGRAEKIVEEI